MDSVQSPVLPSGSSPPSLPRIPTHPRPHTGIEASVGVLHFPSWSPIHTLKFQGLSLSFLCPPAQLCCTIFPHLLSLSNHHTYSYPNKFSLALSLSPLSFPSSFLSGLSAPLPTTTHHFPHLTKSCSPWSPNSASFLTSAISNSLDHPFLRILAALAQQRQEASAQQQGPSDHFLASSLSMDCRGTEGEGLLQQSQQPRTVLGRACPGLRSSALSPRGQVPSAVLDEWDGCVTFTARLFQL